MGGLMAAQTLILRAFLTEKCRFQDLDPLLGIKSVMNVQNHLKLKVQILTFPKYFTPPPLCIFELQNSHFGLIWF